MNKFVLITRAVTLIITNQSNLISYFSPRYYEAEKFKIFYGKKMDKQQGRDQRGRQPYQYRYLNMHP